MDTLILSPKVSVTYFVIDPLGSRRIVNFQGNSVWMTLPWSYVITKTHQTHNPRFTLVNTLSVSIFWSSLVQKNLRKNVNNFLGLRDTIVLGLAAFIFFSQDIVLSSMRYTLFINLF